MIAYSGILLSSPPEKFTRNFWIILYFLALDLRDTVLHNFLHGLKEVSNHQLTRTIVVGYLLALPTKRTMMPFVNIVRRKGHLDLGHGFSVFAN